MVSEDADERKENIVFVFQDNAYRSPDEFWNKACIDGVRISDLKEPVEVVRAGVVGNDTMLSTLWGGETAGTKSREQIISIQFKKTA